MPPFKAIEIQVPYLQGEKIDLPRLRQTKTGAKAIDPRPTVIIKYVTEYLDSTQGKGGH